MLHVIHLSFEGPDPYAHAGGLAVRVTTMAQSLAAMGHQVDLYFIGDPAAAGVEHRRGVTLHRWSQSISARAPGGVYDGEEDKIADWCTSLPRHLADVVAADAAAGRPTMILAEDWHTAWPLICLHDELVNRGLRHHPVLAWTANNRFGFERIDFARLHRAAADPHHLQGHEASDVGLRGQSPGGPQRARPELGRRRPGRRRCRSQRRPGPPAAPGADGPHGADQGGPVGSRQAVADGPARRGRPGRPGTAHGAAGPGLERIADGQRPRPGAEGGGGPPGSAVDRARRRRPRRLPPAGGAGRGGAAGQRRGRAGLPGGGGLAGRPVPGGRRRAGQQRVRAVRAGRPGGHGGRRHRGHRLHRRGLPASVPQRLRPRHRRAGRDHRLSRLAGPRPVPGPQPTFGRPPDGRRLRLAGRAGTAAPVHRAPTSTGAATTCWAGRCRRSTASTPRTCA